VAASPGERRKPLFFEGLGLLYPIRRRILFCSEGLHLREPGVGMTPDTPQARAALYYAAFLDNLDAMSERRQGWRPIDFLPKLAAEWKAR
jgi:hypothetical protein